MENVHKNRDFLRKNKGKVKEKSDFSGNGTVGMGNVDKQKNRQ